MPLDAAVLAELETFGVDVAEVERSVRANAYNHEAACYDMLVTRAQSGQAGERTNRSVAGSYES